MDHLKRLPVVFEEFRAEFAACVLAQPPVQMARVANVEFVVVCTGDVDVVHGQFASRRWTILDEALRLASFAQDIRLACIWPKAMSEPFDSLRSLRALDSPAFGWELAEGHERALRLAALAQDIRLACIWPKAMSEPAGRQASRMAGGGGCTRSADFFSAGQGAFGGMTA